MSRLVLYAAISLATVLAVLLLYQFRVALAILLLSLALAAAVRPLIIAVTSRNLPLSVAIAVVYLAGFFLLALFVAGLGSALMTELPLLGEDLALAYEELYSEWQDGMAWQQALYHRLPAPETLYASIGGDNGQVLGQRLLGFTRGLATGAGLFLLTVIVSVYWSVDQARFERLWLSFLPPRRRTLARNIWRGIESGVGAYVRSEAVQGVLAVLAFSMGYYLLGLRYPTVLTLWSALSWLVPLVGPILALPPVIASALASGVTTAVLSVAYTLLVFVTLEYVVEPRFLRRSRFNAIVTILAMLVLLDSFGFLGLILAPPVAVTVQVALTHTIGQRHERRKHGANLDLANLRQDLIALRKTLAEIDGEATPEVMSLVRRLEGLLQLTETSVGQPVANTGQATNRASVDHGD